MTPIHALICEIHVKCVFMQDMLKSRCKFVTLLGKYAQQKQVGWEVIFSELGFVGSGVRKPRRDTVGNSLMATASIWDILRIQSDSRVVWRFSDRESGITDPENKN